MNDRYIPKDRGLSPEQRNLLRAQASPFSPLFGRVETDFMEDSKKATVL
jgi:hypothetical protein